MTLAEWIGTALLLGAPYGALGVVYAVFRPDYAEQFDGARRLLALLGSVLFWPVLLLAEMCPP